MIFLFYEPVCACACVFNNMCVLERTTHRPTPTERWCLVYDLAARVSASSFGRPIGIGGPLPCLLLTSLAHPQPPIARACFSPEMVSAAPKNRCRIHAWIERTRPLTGACVEGRSGFKSDGCFVRPTYFWVYVI